MSLEKILKEKIERFYNKYKKHIWLVLRVAFLMCFTILVGVNAFYIEDYLILVIIVVTVGALLFFVPIEKIKKFLSLDIEDKK